MIPHSHFMEVQGKEKESLATYIDHFKREAEKCNFTNSVATIRLFIKGLKDAHTIATWVYEKGPQTLADAISEVGKLQATQQLTTTLLPSSAVHVMSHEEDQFFQCQELGHITWHCPHVWCFECDEYGHIVVDCPHRIPPLGTPAHCHRQNFNTRHCTRSTSRHYHWDKYRHSRSKLQSQPCIYLSYSCHDSHRGHSRSHHRDSRHHHRSTPQCHHPSTYWFHHDTPHQRSSSHRSSTAHSKDCSRSQLCPTYKPSKKLCTNLHPTLAELQPNHMIRNKPESQ